MNQFYSFNYNISSKQLIVVQISNISNKFRRLSLIFTKFLDQKFVVTKIINQQISQPMVKQLNNRDFLTSYKILFSLGCFLFTLAALLTLPYTFMSLHQKSDVFSILIKASSLIFVITQLLQLVTLPIPAWRGPLCVMSILGHFAYIHGSNVYWPFNNGDWYACGPVLVSCAAELKILAIVLQKRNFEIVFRRWKGHLVQFGLIAIGNIFFLIGTLMLWKVSAAHRLGPIFNAIGGCVICLSVGSFFIPQQKQKSYLDIKLEGDSTQRQL